ncbi:MAG TPA: hypothetical protein VHZ31_06520 [Solirubrobacteraceae bacterium]|nr:hypothetical protein [Solirubrobacteraceae bacterium]
MSGPVGRDAETVREPTGRMRFRTLIRVPSTSVRIDTATHQELRLPAAELRSGLGATVCRLRQEQIGIASAAAAAEPSHGRAANGSSRHPHESARS